MYPLQRAPRQPPRPSVVCHHRSFQPRPTGHHLWFARPVPERTLILGATVSPTGPQGGRSSQLLKKTAFQPLFSLLPIFFFLFSLLFPSCASLFFALLDSSLPTPVFAVRVHFSIDLCHWVAFTALLYRRVVIKPPAQLPRGPRGIQRCPPLPWRRSTTTSLNARSRRSKIKGVKRSKFHF